jgi:hypothetical protein
MIAPGLFGYRPNIQLVAPPTAARKPAAQGVTFYFALYGMAKAMP